MMLTPRLLLCLVLPAWTVLQTDGGLRTEIESLNQAMTAALKRDPAAVAAFYTDHAAIIGAGQRHQGRAAVAEYWTGGGMFADWRLELLATGGPPHAPWQYGRSVLTGRSGRTMETYFVGLLRRQPAGDLKFQVDVFVREGGAEGGAEATALTEAWLNAVQRGDAKALEEIFDDQFVIISSNGARTKAQEIADLVQPGVSIPYFSSDETQTRGFGTLAVTTGILKWRLRADRPEIQRHYASLAVRRASGWKILAQQVTPVAPPPGAP